MTTNSIFDNTSFNTLDDDSTLDDARKKAVRALYDETYRKGGTLDFDHLQLFGQRQSLTTLLDTYGAQLERLNPTCFKYMGLAQRKALEQQLLFAFSVFSAQYQLDESEHRRQVLADRAAQIKTCALYTDQLRATSFGKKETPETLLKQAMSNSEKYLKYLGLTTVAPYIVAKMMELGPDGTLTERIMKSGNADEPDAIKIEMEMGPDGKIIETIAQNGHKTLKQLRGAGKTDVIKSLMGEVNGRRLYWVWGGGLLNSIVSMLPDNFAHKQQTAKALSTPSPVTGYMSWLLYYTRFGINLFLLLKHTFAGPWMSEKERQIPMGDRFKTQWAQRKFSLLNDSIWATANLAGFYWLIGNGMLGYMGNVATAALLLMDTCLTAWRFWEEKTKHKENMARYERDIERLSLKMAELINVNHRQYLILEHERTALIKIKDQCALDLKYKEYSLINDLVYAASLLTAFAVVCCCFFPPALIAPATAMIFGLVGAALCFILTTAYTAIGSGIEIAKNRASQQAAQKQHDTLEEEFTRATDIFTKKQLYLDMKQLSAETAYQEKLIRFQKIKLTHSILVDALIPALVFIAFMFMPWGIGLGVLAAGLALAVISGMILNRFAPKKEALPDLNEQEYANFDIQQKNKQEAKNNSGFPLQSNEQQPGFFTQNRPNGINGVNGDEQAVNAV